MVSDIPARDSKTANLFTVYGQLGSFPDNFLTGVRVIWPRKRLSGNSVLLPDDGADAEEVVVNGPEALWHPVTAESPQEENDEDQRLRK